MFYRCSKRCSNVVNPNHRLKAYRKPCGQPLMMTIKSDDGRKVLHPIKLYCYKPLKESLQDLIKRKDFEDECEMWRDRKISNDILCDIYDGAIWKDFNSKYDFFSKPKNYGFIVNLDWFAPYKHVRNVSVGAIYLVIANLPRSKRFLRKNVILVGLIPNMQKEPRTNTFLKPLVDDLLIAWNDGFELISCDGLMNIHKAVLLCVGCDIPAARKLCGFLGNNFTISE